MLALSAGRGRRRRGLVARMALVDMAGEQIALHHNRTGVVVSVCTLTLRSAHSPARKLVMTMRAFIRPIAGVYARAQGRWSVLYIKRM